MLRNCVKEITETTMVVPHLNEKGLIDSKLDSLNKKMNKLQQVFGYKRTKKSVSEVRGNQKIDLIKQGEESYGVKLSFQYEKALADSSKTMSVSEIAKRIQNQKEGRFGDNFSPSQPIQNINLTSAFKAKEDVKEGKKKKLNMSSID